VGTFGGVIEDSLVWSNRRGGSLEGPGGGVMCGDGGMTKAGGGPVIGGNVVGVDSAKDDVGSCGSESVRLRLKGGSRMEGSV